ncbi:YjcZ family sporulation protein [Paenibacillus terrae]|uniref:YjcZ family sporulation protein n=1 Tax=Paenibacillus terrae TaxID=159743 RepID=UPI0039952B6E
MKGGVHVSECVGGVERREERRENCFGAFTSPAAILVLFILLVIITKACWI